MARRGARRRRPDVRVRRRWSDCARSRASTSGCAARWRPGRETATLAPLRWRSRPALARYVEAEVHVERAIRNARVLMRRTVSLLRNAEPVPAELAQAPVRAGRSGRDSLRRELADGVEAERARELLTAAVGAASSAYRDGVGFSGGVVVAQIRSAAVDLLRATGLTEERAEQLVRQAGPLHAGHADEARLGSRPWRSQTSAGPPGLPPTGLPTARGYGGWRLVALAAAVLVPALAVIGIVTYLGCAHRTGRARGRHRRRHPARTGAGRLFPVAGPVPAVAAVADRRPASCGAPAWRPAARCCVNDTAAAPVRAVGPPRRRWSR